MMMKTLLLALAVAFSSQDPDEAIRQLCQTLGSEDAEARERASQELVAKGRAALKPVRELLSSGDAEVRARAQAILGAIHQSLRKHALKLAVAPDKARYLPGENITLRATLTNVEDFPVAVAKFIYDGGICPESWIQVTSDGRRVQIVGDSLPQVMIHGKVDESRFLTIQPGETVTIRAVAFSRLWILGGKDGGLKASYSQARTAPPAPGTYSVKATYAFQRAEDPLLQLGFGSELEFAGDSKRLLEEAWKGSLQAETRFEVIEASK